MSAVFYRKGYAFATDGHMAVIRRTDADEPQRDVAVTLPAPNAKVLDMGFCVVENTNILVSIDGAVTGSMSDMQGPALEQILKARTSRGRPIRITLNAKHLLDIAKAIGADKDMGVTLELDANNLNQMILVATTGSSTLGILMPFSKPKNGETIPSEVLGNILAVL
jgi:DNA polymerase III sliding clamp (beta) subunit (PCNA family)